MPNDTKDWFRPVVAGLRHITTYNGTSTGGTVTIYQPERQLLIACPGQDHSIQDCQVYVASHTAGTVVYSAFVGRGSVVPIFVDPTWDTQWDITLSTGFTGGTVPWEVFADTSPALVDVARGGQQSMGNSIPVALASDQTALPVAITDPSAASYVITATGCTIASAGWMLTMGLSSTLDVKVRRVRIWQDGLAAAAGGGRLELWRATTLGTGGVSQAARRLDNNDGASAITAYRNPAAGVTSSNRVYVGVIPVLAAWPTGPQPELCWDMGQPHGMKPWLLRAGQNEAMGVFNPGSTVDANATFSVQVEWTEA